MRRAHYPLQAMFYLVALHRYLRWRIPGYDPAVNLGGAFYLFLRGMACPGPVTEKLAGTAFSPGTLLRARDRAVGSSGWPAQAGAVG